MAGKFKLTKAKIKALEQNLLDHPKTAAAVLSKIPP